MKRATEKVGIFGGSFDPPHAGHLAVARAARDRVGLDRVLFMPAPNPPHKRGTWASFEDRCRMVELLVQNEQGLELFTVEKELAPPHYTVRTLEHLRRGPFEGCELFLIIGADSLVELHTWKEYRRLFELSRPVVVSRPGYSLDRHRLEPELAAQVVRIQDVEEEISSTHVREALQAGLAPEDMPADVLGFIRERGLYSDSAPAAAQKAP
jgi:nicotinate-nucleotide adenylyltransferase